MCIRDRSITYHDEENDTMVTLNSKSDSVDMDGLNLQKLKNGLRFNFTFPAVDITVPFTVLLNDDGSMTAKIAVDAIEERSSYDLFSVSMLPYFCAASDKDKGFALIPDGSGAVMTLNNGKTAYSAYSQPVYGGDAGEIAKSEVTTPVSYTHLDVYKRQLPLILTGLKLEIILFSIFRERELFRMKQRQKTAR